MRRLLGTAAVLLLGTLTACGGESDAATADEAITFAFPPGTEDPEQLAQIEPLADMIGEATGREVATESPADYLGVVEAVRTGHVDVAFLSPFAAAIGNQAGGLDVGLAWEAGDDPAGVLLARAGSDIEALEDVAGHEVAFVDPGSTTGHFMPRAALAEAGLEAGTDYEMTYAGGHDSAILALQQGSVDVAATAAMLRQTFIDSGVMDPEEIRVIGETEPIPVGSTIVFSEEVDPEVRSAIVAELPDLVAADEAMGEIFGGENAIADPDDEVFAPLLQATELIGLELEDIR